LSYELYESIIWRVGLIVRLNSIKPLGFRKSQGIQELITLVYSGSVSQIHFLFKMDLKLVYIDLSEKPKNVYI